MLQNIRRSMALEGLVPFLMMGLVVAGMTSPLVISAISPSPAIAQTKVAQAERKRAVVLDFYNGNSSNRYWSNYYGGGAAGNGLSQKMIESLLEGGKVRVADRGVITKYDWYRTPTSEALKAAKNAGIDYVIVGTVTEFNVESSRSGGGAFGVSIGGKKTVANVELSARVIDTEYGDIIATASGSGQAKKGDGSLNVRGIGGNTSSSNEDRMLNAATNQAMDEMMAKLNDKL